MSSLQFNGYYQPQINLDNMREALNSVEKNLIEKTLQDLRNQGLLDYDENKLIKDVDSMISCESYKTDASREPSLSISLKQSFSGTAFLKSRIAKLESLLNGEDPRALEHRIRSFNSSGSVDIRIFKMINGLSELEIKATIDQLFKVNQKKASKKYTYHIEDFRYDRNTDMIILSENVIDRSYPISHKVYFKHGYDCLVYFKGRYTIWKFELVLRNDFVKEVKLTIDLDPDVTSKRKCIPTRLNLKRKSKVTSTFQDVFLLIVPNVYNLYLKEVASEYWLTELESKFVLKSPTYQTNCGMVYNISMEVMLLSRYEYMLTMNEAEPPLISLRQLYDFYSALRVNKDFYHGDIKPQNIGFDKKNGFLLIDYYKKNGGEIRYKNDLFYQNMDIDGCTTAEHYAFMLSVAASCGYYLPRYFCGYITLVKINQKYYLHSDGKFRVYISPVAPFEFIIKEMLDKDMTNPIHGIVSTCMRTEYKKLCDDKCRLCHLLNGECTNYESSKQSARLKDRPNYNLSAITRRDYLSM